MLNMIEKNIYSAMFFIQNYKGLRYTIPFFENMKKSS